MPTILEMFEGAGASVKGNLYEPYYWGFQNTFFILASNKLPTWSIQRENPHLYRRQWLPLESRVNLVMLNEDFTDYQGEFPYDTPILATALRELLARA